MEEVLAQFHEFLYARSLMATDVRQEILGGILAREGHFDIDELVCDLKVHGLEASRATVYRALPLLEEAGIFQSTLTEVLSENHSGQRSQEPRAQARRRHHIVMQAQ